MRQAGNYLCTFHIANGSANDRSMMITVNSGNDKWKQSFLTTGAWTAWEERAIVLPLIAGINRIRLQSNTAEDGPNFDYLRLTRTDEPVPDVYDPSQEQTVQQPVSESRRFMSHRIRPRRATLQARRCSRAGAIISRMISRQM